MNEVRLIVDGQSYVGWQSIAIERSLDQFVNSFDFEYSDRWSESTSPRVLLLGAKAEIVVDGTRLLIGWIDQVALEVGSSTVSGSAQGRSKTGDLVDCSAVHPTGQWRNQLARRIISDLVQPFGLEVEYDPLIVDDIRIPRFDLAYGETVFEAIDRLSRLRGMIPTTTTKGNLRFVRVSKTAGLRVVQLDLREVISRRYSASQQDLFSAYRLASQSARSQPGENPRRAALERFEVSDPNVKRYRPLVVRSETGAKQVELKDHAQWVANQHAAQAERVNYELSGFYAPDKKLWEPGTLVYVNDPVLGVNDTFVSAAVRMQAANNSVTTQLSLARADAYNTEPISRKELIKKLKRL